MPWSPRYTPLGPPYEKGGRYYVDVEYQYPPHYGLTEDEYNALTRKTMTVQQLISILSSFPGNTETNIGLVEESCTKKYTVNVPLANATYTETKSTTKVTLK